MIKLVISPEYFGNNDSQRDIREQLKKLGAHSIEIDKTTGFVSALMTVDNYESFVEGLKKRIEKIAADIKEKYSGVKDIRFNGDYTVFYVKISRLSKNERKAVVFDLLMASATYQVISGIPQTDASIKVKFYDGDDKLVECVDTAERKKV